MVASPAVAWEEEIRSLLGDYVVLFNMAKNPFSVRFTFHDLGKEQVVTIEDAMAKYYVQTGVSHPGVYQVTDVVTDFGGSVKVYLKRVVSFKGFSAVRTSQNDVHYIKSYEMKDVGKDGYTFRSIVMYYNGITTVRFMASKFVIAKTRSTKDITTAICISRSVRLKEGEIGRCDDGWVHIE